MHGWVSRSSAVCRGCAGEGRGREGRGGDPCPRWVWRREHGANTWTKHTDPHVQAVMSRQTKGTLVEHHARHGQCRGLDVFGSNTHLFSLESRWMEDSQPASQRQGHEKGFSWENSYHNISQLGLLPFKSLCVGGSARRNPAGRGPFGGLRPATFAVTACSGGTLSGGSEEEFHGSLKGGEKAPSWLLGPLCSQPLHREAGGHGEQRRRGATQPWHLAPGRQPSALQTLATRPQTRALPDQCMQWETLCSAAKPPVGPPPRRGLGPGVVWAPSLGSCRGAAHGEAARSGMRSAGGSCLLQPAPKPTFGSPHRMVSSPSPLHLLPPALSSARQGSSWAPAAGKMLELNSALSFQELPSPSGLLSAGFPMRQLQKPR